MASKSKASSKKTTKTAKKAVEITPVRYSALPKITAPTAAARKATFGIEDIARKAFEIYASGNGGTEFDNWVRAERELKAA